MILDTKTIQVLKAFSMINPSLVFNPGNVIRTISPGKTVLAQATVPVTFDRRFGIYDLMRFLGAYSMFEDGELEFNDTHIKIGNNREAISYVYAEASLIPTPPDKNLTITNPVVEFDLSGELLQRTLKAMGMIGAPEIAVTGESGVVYLEAVDTTKRGSSSYRAELGKTDREFQLIFSADKLKLLPADYKVAITDKFAHFSSPGIEYWVVLESNSRID